VLTPISSHNIFAAEERDQCSAILCGYFFLPLFLLILVQTEELIFLRFLNHNGQIIKTEVLIMY
jgi:hypothetical protein